jgi:hypothetical protein
MTQFKSDALAREEMQRALHHFDARRDNIPKRVDPVFVESFVRDAMAKVRPTALAAHVIVMLADFYDARPLAADFITWLDRTERDEAHFLSSLALTRGVGLLGDSAERQHGRSYFEHLLGLSYAEQRMPELLACHGVYALEKSSRATGLRIDAIVTALQVREATDPTAGMARRGMEDLRAVRLPRVEAAATMQRDILALSPEERRARLVDLYLGLDLSYYEQLQRWVVRAIQHEARSAGNHVVVAALRAAEPRLDQGVHDTQPVSVEAVDARRRRLFAAVEFFEGTLSPAEEAEMRPDEKRLELLSTEP